MKKIFLSLITVAALLMCSCEKENVTPGGGGGTNPDQPVIDITPYLGKYLMTRHTDLSISVLNMFTFPLDRDLDVEVVTVKKDPAVQHGLIITNNDALYLRGVVATNGLHLQCARQICGQRQHDSPRHPTPCQRQNGMDQHCQRLRFYLRAGHACQRHHHGQHALQDRYQQQLVVLTLQTWTLPSRGCPFFVSFQRSICCNPDNGGVVSP